MEKLEKKYENLIKIHSRLADSIESYRQALADKNISTAITEEKRDSLIKRFELTYDQLWKYLREYIAVVEGVTVDSPRKVFQQCLSLGLINNAETENLIALIEDRNLTTHTYNSDLADKVANDIQKHYDAINAVIKKVPLDIAKK